MWALLRKKPGGPSSSTDFLELCKQNVCSIREILDGGILLNRKQCLDLSTKLSKTIQNIREVVAYSAAPNEIYFKPGLQSLYRHLEKARLLVSNCEGKDFCLAALYQNRNENAFREILLDVSLCYNAIYEQAKSTREDWNDNCPEDLRQSLVFRPAEMSAIHKDQEVLIRKLESIDRRRRTPTIFGSFLYGDHEQHLARYLLLRLKQSQFDTCIAMLWSKESEPSGTWGQSRFIGAGSGASGVVSTSWLGARCAKREYLSHWDNDESFFLKEAIILARLNHPHVVKIFCSGSGSEKASDRFIAMELMQKSLLDLIKDQKGVHFELLVAINIMVQLARGICYLHDQGIAHRNINPYNALITTFPSPHLEDFFDVKLINFGWSKEKVEASIYVTVSAPGIGTARYRAPELNPRANPHGKANWFKADAFSFASTCSHLLSLQRPFVEHTSLRMLNEVYTNGARPNLPIGCPEEVVALLESCWDPNPNRRPSFIEISTMLEAFSEKLLRQSSTLQTDGMSYNFIKSKIEEFSSIQRLSVRLPKNEENQFYLDLSRHNLQIIKDLVEGGNMLNTRQCHHLSSKLSDIIQNIQALVSKYGESADLLSAVQILYRYIEKAKLLVENCCSKDSCTTSCNDTWSREDMNKALCEAAVFQIQNERAFSEILHEVSLCYKAIYEQAKSVGHGMTEGLCQADKFFWPPSSDDVCKDQEEIKKKLEDIANPYSSFETKGILIQCLAKHLLMKLNFVIHESQIKPLEASNAIFWTLNYFVNDLFIDEKIAWGSDKFIGRGSGAAGVVYTQWLGVPCAKKIFSDEQETFLYREGGILIRLNHPRIIKFICCGNGKGHGERFIAMECMEKSLGDLIMTQAKKERPFSLPVALDIIVQIARGMKYMHDMGVTHRDLKPANVVVKRLALRNLPDFFSVKLLDFGDSKTGIQASEYNIISQRGVGTTRYRAPEIHPKAYKQGESGTAEWFKADVFSFAMTCLHILSLKIPFHEIDLELEYELGRESMYGELKGGRRPELPEDYPEELTTLIERCWLTEPSKRPSFEDICIELEGFLLKFPRELTMHDWEVEGTSQADGESKLKNVSTTNGKKKNDEVHDDDIEGEEDDNLKKITDEYLSNLRNIDEATISKAIEMLELKKAELQNSERRTQASSSSGSRPHGELQPISEEAHTESVSED